MKQSECLYEIARRIRAHGFSSESNMLEPDGPHCFYGHKWQIPLSQEYVELFVLHDVIGVGPVFTDTLIQAGWIDGCDDDAAAACEIAGDIAFEHERRA